MSSPNGVGKTTFARKFLPKYANCKNFVNADLMSQTAFVDPPLSLQSVVSDHGSVVTTKSFRC